MGSGEAMVVSASKAGTYTMDSLTAMYQPGTVHWEGSKGYIYAKAQVTLPAGAPCFRTGTASLELACHPTAADTGIIPIGVAVSDIATSYYGWLQMYGPCTQLRKASGTVPTAYTYLLASNTSAGCRWENEGDATYAAGVFGYCLEAETEAEQYISSSYLFNML